MDHKPLNIAHSSCLLKQTVYSILKHMELSDNIMVKFLIGMV